MLGTVEDVITKSSTVKCLLFDAFEYTYVFLYCVGGQRGGRRGRGKGWAEKGRGRGGNGDKDCEGMGKGELSGALASPWVDCVRKIVR